MPANHDDSIRTTLLARVQRGRSLAGPWSGTVFRSTSIKYSSSQDLLSGEGSRLHGGRWNPPGEFAAVYASLDPETAMAEALAHYRIYGIPLDAAMPRLFVSIEVRLSSVLDVRDRGVRRRHGVSLRQLRFVEERAATSGCFLRTWLRKAHLIAQVDESVVSVLSRHLADMHAKMQEDLLYTMRVPADTWGG